MKEKKKRLTLQTPYNTLLSHVWQFKKNSYDLDKQNQQLKSKIVFRTDMKKDKCNKPKKEAHTTPLKLRVRKQPSAQLMQKLDNLMKDNCALKSQLIELEENKKVLIDQLQKMPKIQRKIKKIEQKLKKSHHKLRKQQFYNKKIIHVGSKKQNQEATIEFIQQSIQKQDQNYAVLQDRIEQCYKKLSKASVIQKNLGKQIIDLIEHKAILRKKVKENNQQKCNVKNL